MAGEKILNIDDSPTVQRLIEMILSSQGYKVVLASDGEAGIAMAKAERPEVILVDFVMPKMNGFQVCKTLKEDPEFQDTPIILVTSKGDKVGSKFVDVLGITEYFTKPFQPEELLAKIREVIDKRKARSQGERLPGMSGGPLPSQSAASPCASPSRTAQPVHAAAAQSSGLENLVREIVDEHARRLRQEPPARSDPAGTGKGGRTSQTPGRDPGQPGQLPDRGSDADARASAPDRTGSRSTRQDEQRRDLFPGGLGGIRNGELTARLGIEALLRKTCHLAEESLKYVAAGRGNDRPAHRQRPCPGKADGPQDLRRLSAAAYRVGRLQGHGLA